MGSRTKVDCPNLYGSTNDTKPSARRPMDPVAGRFFREATAMALAQVVD
jgi:hypothetical protein